MSTDPHYGLNFNSIISKFNSLQKHVKDQIASLAKNMCNAQPGAFLLLQFTMSKITQVGDSLSNLIATYNSGIMSAVRNQRAQ